MAVSLSGTRCALDCGHCGGSFLRRMKSPSEADLLLLSPDNEYRSLLVSGGCDDRGRVVQAEHLPMLNRWHSLGLRLNVHAGLVCPDVAARLAPISDVVSLDFVFDRQVAAAVYGNRSWSYDRAFSDLNAAGCRVVPHICIGLNRGADSGEIDSLEAVRSLGADRVVLLVFFPVPGTRFSDSSPPPLDRVLRVVEAAVRTFGGAGVTIGCMRPGGRYRRELDRLAVAAGVTGVVMPSRDLVQTLETGGREINWSRECCAL